jgi:hypothetical protein
MSRRLIERFIAFAILLHVLGGCSSSKGSGDGSNGGPPSSGSAKVEFGNSGQDWVETDGHTSAPLALSSTQASPVFLPYTASGSAVEGVHYSLDPGPLEIPAGASFTSLLIGIKQGLPIFENDVELVLTLGTPTGAILGQTLVHTVHIVNDGIFSEIEPNDDPQSANPLDGRIGPGRSGTVTGHVQPEGGVDVRDAFVIRADEDVQVEFVLHPIDAAADVSLWLSRSDVVFNQIIDGRGPGEDEVGVFSLNAGQAVIATVVTAGAETDYELGLLGVDSGLVAAGSGGSDDPLVDLNLDWDSTLRLWTERKRARASESEVVGRGSWVDLDSGSTRSVELLGLRRR